MDNVRTSPFNQSFMWKDEDDARQFLRSHGGYVIGINSEAGELSPVGSVSLGPYSSIAADPSKIQFPFEIPSLADDPWDNPPSQTASVDSPSSYATPSADVSQCSSNSSSVANSSRSFYAPDLSDFEYQASEPSGDKFKEFHKLGTGFPCTLCQGHYRTAWGLRNHLRIHTDKRSFTCTLCKKGFARRDNLKRHENSHQKGMLSPGDGDVRLHDKEVRPAKQAIKNLGPFFLEQSTTIPNLAVGSDAKYSKQSTLQWSEPAQFDVGLDEVDQQSRCPISDCNISADECNIERCSDSQVTEICDMLGNSDVTSYILASEISGPPKGEPDISKGQINMQPIELSSNKHSSQATLTSWYAAIGEEYLENTHTAKIFGSNDFGEGTKALKLANNQVSLLHNCSIKHNQPMELSPVWESPSTTGRALGKASPYSVQDQDIESDFCIEDESETNFDENSHVLSPSPSFSHISDLWAPKQMLIIEILRRFWEIYNKEFRSIVSTCIASTAKDFNNEATSDAPTSSSCTSASSAAPGFSTGTSSSVSSSLGSKRKSSEDGRPPDDGDQGSRGPIQGSMVMPKDQLGVRYACPFRKHNPRKYNMHHYQSCALGSFGSIARVKEHLYRRHIAPIQCVRCWLFFKDQETLNIHISAANICDLRNGEVAEGITPSTEKKLRSRKRMPGGQNDSDRWRDIYRILFPGVADEDIPSPFFESVQDDAAQASALLDLPIEEFMRQEVPQFFTARLQTEVENMNLEQTGLLDDPARLRETFIVRMTSLITEAQDAAVEAYRQRSSQNVSLLNQPMTPGRSSNSDSVPNPADELSRALSYQCGGASQIRQPSSPPSWSQDLQSIDRVAADEALHDYLSTHEVQEAEIADIALRSDSYLQLTKKDAPPSLELRYTDVECFTATDVPQPEYRPNKCSTNSEWAVPDAWDLDADSWLNENPT